MIEAIDEDPTKTFKMLENELHLHMEEFKDRPRIILFTKSDLVEELPEINIPDVDILSISSVTGVGLKELVDKLVRILEDRIKKTNIWDT